MSKINQIIFPINFIQMLICPYFITNHLKIIKRMILLKELMIHQKSPHI